jgi:hypothetical protein
VQRRLLEREDLHLQLSRGLTVTAPSLDAAEATQDAVSRALHAQVLSALRELLRGFEDADRAAQRRLLRGHEQQIHAGLVSVLMRMVFVLFAEEQGLLPVDADLYAGSYSLTGLHARLQQDEGRHGRAMDERYGAWARVVALFRLLHDGIRSADGLFLPPRRGRIFDPDLYPFLEGRAPPSRGPLAEPLDLPRISDGTVFRVLDRLLVQGGGLDVEHVGAAYEGLLGFEVRVAGGLSLTLQPDDVVVDVDALAALDGQARIDHLAGKAGLDLKGKIARAVRAAARPSELLASLSARASPRQPDPIPAGAFFLQPSEDRRRLGAHYTSRAITKLMVERTLGPLLRDGMSPDEILALRVCDPAMGSGAFLVEACRQLAEHLAGAWERAATELALPTDEVPILHARRLVAQRCLYGVDRNALAVDLARLSLWLVTSARGHAFTFVDHALRHGDALVGLTREQIAGVALDAGRRATVSTARASVLDETLRTVRATGDLLLAAFFSTQDRRAQARAMASVPDLVERMLHGRAGGEVDGLLAALHGRHVPFHWEIELPEVFAEGRGGFDAIVGNPPWVSYSGRAAQPLAGDLRDFYITTSPAFHGYRNLQGVFVHRAAAMLRPGGRLGLVLPTSMSDLGGYEPSRRAHDALCVCDDDLPDFGDGAFEGVFQPSMGLLSTRRPAPASIEEAGPWPLQRNDLDGETIALLDALGALPRLPPHLFGERGFQSRGEDVRHLHALPGPEGAFTAGVRVGGDIEPFLRRPPQSYCDPRVFGERFRSADGFRAVKLLIRQTARYPMVALSDGQAFRNSILAGFADGDHSEHLLLAYLNSAPIRWLHYMRHRDARQGMPQMKIAHLRALPAPPRSAPGYAALERLGREIGERNAGVSAAEQEEIDRLAADALGVPASARARIAAWACSVRG